MLADVFGKTLQVPNISEGVAFGAAVLGFVSAGVLNDIADTGNLVAVEKSVQPAPTAAACYKRLYTIYEQVYWSLQQAFTEISSYQNEQPQ